MSQPAVSCVYFIRSPINNLIKIGSTGNPIKTRFRAIVLGSPVPLDLMGHHPGTLADEIATHRRFAHLREHGEWFRAEPDLLQHIEEMCGEKARAARAYAARIERQNRSWAMAEAAIREIDNAWYETHDSWMG